MYRTLSKLARVGATVCLALAGTAAPSQAQFITDASALGATTQTITFSQFLTQTSVPSNPQVPVSVSLDAMHPVTISSMNPAANFSIVNSAYALGGYFPQYPELNDAQYCTNGEWSSARQGFVGLFPGSVARFSFGGRAIQGVGAKLNYLPMCARPSQGLPTMRLLGLNNEILDSYNIDALGRIVTPNALNAGAFRGALRASADIYAVEFVGAFMVLDDLIYTTNISGTPTTTVPEPGTVLLMAAGLGLLGVVAGRRRLRTSSPS